MRMTNWNLVQEQWSELATKVKARWGRLSAAEIQGMEGKRPRLIAKLQESYKIFQLEAENQVNTWTAKLGLIDPNAPAPAPPAPTAPPTTPAGDAKAAEAAEPPVEASASGVVAAEPTTREQSSGN